MGVWGGGGALMASGLQPQPQGSASRLQPQPQGYSRSPTDLVVPPGLAPPALGTIAHVTLGHLLAPPALGELSLLGCSPTPTR